MIDFRPLADMYCIQNAITENVSDYASFMKGVEVAESMYGWHSVHDLLPPVDEEVIVLVDEGVGLHISFGHMVDTDRCIDYDGWNIPDVVFWMFQGKTDMIEEYKNR